MKVLFDQNVPLALAKFLVDHHVTTAKKMGWAQLKNGSLLEVAEANGFELLITADRNLSYQQNLAGRRIAIVVLPSGQWPRLERLVAEVVKAAGEASPGTFADLGAVKRPKARQAP